MDPVLVIGVPGRARGWGHGGNGASQDSRFQAPPCPHCLPYWGLWTNTSPVSPRSMILSVNIGPGAWVPDLEGRGPEGQACLLPLEVCFLQTLICGC